MRLGVGITLAVGLALPSRINAFTLCQSQRQRIVSPYRFCPSITNQLARRTTKEQSRLAAKKGKDDDDADDGLPPGMADAFRRLESLESLDDSASNKSKRPPKASPESMKQAAKSVQNAIASQSKPSVPLEKEAQMYKKMVTELETMDEQDLYQSILGDMGGADEESYSTPAASSTADATSSPISSRDGLLKAELSINDELMNQALEAAMTEIEKDYPALKNSILNDKELMQEIEAIFDRGNEKLIGSLEDIRKEQSDLARGSAMKKTQNELDSLDNDTRRLEQAEASISTMLKRVNAETAEVVAAVEDLKRVQEDLDRDFLFRVKNGGAAKQGALVGLVLFSVRSIVDSVASFGDETHLLPALVQGAIAILCAAYFFLV
ncbi:hypothetical protein MPSEU_000608600 [Mayamaea pseudoterrestris]|nr:hypothetical protein MPSEU_000608600 [Mayamaea pseudoterrestris]